MSDLAQAEGYPVAVPLRGSKRDMRAGAEALLIAAVAIGLFVALAWVFISDPGSLARGRDPAQLTWRAQALLSDHPAILVEKHGPATILSGGYRVTTPLLGALLYRLAGVGTYRFTALLEVLLPLLAAAALGGFAYRHRRDPLAFVFTMTATALLFLGRIFVGYLDDQLGLALLAVALAFLDPARDAWGPRIALGLLVFLSFLTHIPTAPVFVAAVAAWGLLGLLARRLSLRRTLKELGPAMAAVAVGAGLGILVWYAGAWGPSTSLSDSLTVQPYSAAFFRSRLREWLAVFLTPTTALLVAAGLGWLLWRVAHRRVDGHVRMSLLWALPIVGLLGYLVGLRYNYYRFLNATLAPALIIGTGAWILAQGFLWLGRRAPLLRVVAVVGLLAVGFLVWRPLLPGIRFIDHQSEWVSDRSRVALSAASAYAAREPGHPLVFLMRPPVLPVRGWGYATQWAHIILAGMHGDEVRRTYFFLGDLQDYLAGRPTEFGNRPLDDLSRGFLEDTRAGLAAWKEPPVVFFLRTYNKKTSPPHDRLYPLLENAAIVQGQGVAPPDTAGIVAAKAAADRTEAEVFDRPGLFSDPSHEIVIGAGLVLLLVVPGALAAPSFGLRGFVDHLAFAPGLSLAMVLFAAFVVEAVGRAPFGPAQAWISETLAVAAGGALRLLALRRRAVEPSPAGGASAPQEPIPAAPPPPG